MQIIEVWRIFPFSSHICALTAVMLGMRNCTSHICSFHLPCPDRAFPYLSSRQLIYFSYFFTALLIFATLFSPMCYLTFKEQCLSPKADSVGFVLVFFFCLLISEGFCHWITCSRQISAVRPPWAIVLWPQGSCFLRLLQ